MSDPSIRLADGHLVVGDDRIPFVAGEVQFWRLDPAHWPAVLDAVRDLGVPIVSTYLSWRRHEPEPGRYDWGGTDPSLDAGRFLDLCAERGLRVLLKPGPWICAEEPGGGYPDWLTARHEEMVRGAGGRLALGYDRPLLHPVPSLGSGWYRDRAERWLREVWGRLGVHARPGGPIVAVQLDNEPSYAFQDGLYFADYHEGTVARYRTWLAARYGEVGRWHETWGAAAGEDFADAEPPRPPVAAADEASPVGAIDSPTPYRRAVVDDWVAFLESELVGHLDWLRGIHRSCGVGHLLCTVNLIPNAVHEMPLRHRAVRDGLAGRAAVGVDHYYDPPLGWNLVDVIARTAASARAAGEPVVWAPELMAGIWRMPTTSVDYPDPFPEEQAAWWGAAMALGYHGFTWYMLADRENWQYAPIGANGTVSRFAEPVRALLRLLRDQPELLESRPISVVRVLWSRRDALDAYSSVGTMREPTVPWADPERRRAFDQHTAITGALLRAGHVYDLWEPGGALPEDAVLLAPSSSADADAVAASGARGLVVDGAPDARILPRPPAVVRGAAAGVESLAAVHRGPSGRRYLHVVQWGEVASAGAGALEVDPALLPAGGDWEPLLGTALTRTAESSWLLPTVIGHRVFRWNTPGWR